MADPANAMAELAQQLIQALQQAGAAAAAAQPVPAAAAAAIEERLSPFDGGTLNLASKTDSQLFTDACKALPTTFSGKPEDLPSFIKDLSERAQFCRWDSEQHGILTVGIRNLLTDYGAITEEDINEARNARINGTHHSRQNALMMYQCVYASLTDEAKTQLIGRSIPSDGPTLFYTVVRSTFTATFSHAQSTREQLMTLHPKKFNYDVAKINDFIRVAFQAINAVTPTTPVSDQEALFLIFRVYKQIKNPSDWLHHIRHLENTAATASLKPAELMSQATAKFNELKDHTSWKPSDLSAEEQFIAMMNKQLQSSQKKPNKNNKNNKNKNDKKKKDEGSKKPPPFASQQGKPGDSKEWDGKTWHYCPFDHKTSHWVLHEPKDCKMAKAKHKKGPNTNAQAGANKQVKVDADKLRSAIAELQNSDSSSPEEVARAVLAVLDLQE